MDDFKDQVRKGFNKCKLDIEEVALENSSLKDQVIILREENKDLKKDLTDMQSELLELKAELKGFNIALEVLKGIQGSRDIGVQGHRDLVNRGESFAEQIEKPVQVQKKVVSLPKKDPYEALLAFKAKANKRDILKQKLISMVSENGINLSELKFLFVDHYKYCSKATFYNYLKEVELEKIIRIERENSKNYVYLSNQMRKEI